MFHSPTNDNAPFTDEATILVTKPSSMCHWPENGIPDVRCPMNIEDENNKTHHKVFNKRIKMPNVRKASKMKTDFSSSRPLIQIIRAPIQYESRHCTTPTELINGISPEPSIIISICSVWCTICAIPLNQNHSINYDNKRIYTMPSTCFFLSCFSHQSARPTRQRQ